MNKIKLLDQKTANRIAAGEVIINPASVIKELIENSIDAKASSIMVKIKKGGKDFISIKDNGEGISGHDAMIAFKRHATSKINTLEDLENTNTLGFRGEALASIAAVSKINMITKERKAKIGQEIHVQGSNLMDSREVGCPPGTHIMVEDLFYNTPARYKYLKKDSIEAGYVSTIIERIALSHPEISIKFINEDRQIFHTPGNGDLFSCIYSLFGKDFANNLIEMDYLNHPLKIKGFIGKPTLTRSNRNYQIFFVNKRYIKNKILHNALDEAFKGLVMIHKLPVCILNIQLPQNMLDINVHPAKTEILFRNESLIYLLLKQALIERLRNENLIPEVLLSNQKYNEKEEAEDKVQEEIPIEMTGKPIINLMNNYKDKARYVENKELSKGNFEKTDHEGFKDNFADVYSPRNEVQKSERKNELENLFQGRIIGQLFSTYIIIEVDKEVYLIDQHAAHERIIFNRFKERYDNNIILTQKLMFPLNMEVSYYEMQLILNFRSLLNRIGFEIEEFGSNSLLIRSVPFIFGQPQDSKFLLEMIHNLEEIKDIKLIQEQENKLITMACKNAIKANDSLKIQEISQLINDLKETKQPYTCPHGRPIIVKLTKYELEKMFKRIQ